MTKVFRSLLLILTILLLVPYGDRALASDKAWSLRLEPLFVDVGGHDPPLVTSGSGNLILETDSGPGFRFEILRQGKRQWDWGVAFFWFTGAQDTNRQTTSGGPGNPVTWEIADGALTSSSPNDVLFLQRLEDTDLNAWTADIYTLRTLSWSDRGSLQLLLGVRNADFDNDIRAVVGIEAAGGTRIDASSNYSRMIGPLVGLSVDRERGKHLFELTLTQSAVTGDAELSAAQSDFVGDFEGEAQEFTTRRTFAVPKNVTIPITELRARWDYQVTPALALGLGAHVSVWTDVSIPPGVRPAGSLESTYETTVTFSGLVAAVEIAL